MAVEPQQPLTQGRRGMQAKSVVSRQAAEKSRAKCLHIAAPEQCVCHTSPSHSMTQHTPHLQQQVHAMVMHKTRHSNASGQATQKRLSHAAQSQTHPPLRPNQPSHTSPNPTNQPQPHPACLQACTLCRLLRGRFRQLGMSVRKHTLHTAASRAKHTQRMLS